MRSLRSLGILDTLPEEEYDSIVALASYICGTEKALITLVDNDRQWFKAKVGFDINETARDISFCGHAINKPHQIFEIPDAREDARFHDNPLVTQKEEPVVFYAGIPLVDSEEHALGSLCVIDSMPHTLSHKQRSALKYLGSQVEKLLQLRATKKQLEANNDLLRKFAGTVSHDMKMPMANIIVTSDVMTKKYGDVLGEDGARYLNYLKSSSMSLSTYVTNLLEHYESSAQDYEAQDHDLLEILEESIEMLSITEDVHFDLPEDNCSIPCSKAAMKQVFVNLIGNSLKYNDKDRIIIGVDCTSDDDTVTISVTDNGMGIPYEKQESVFDLFTTAAGADRHGERGHGIGLSTVRNLIIGMNGRIRLESEPGVGTEFMIILPIPKL